MLDCGISGHTRNEAVIAAQSERTETVESGY